MTMPKPPGGLARPLTAWAEKRSLGPVSVASISLALAVCAAGWFSAGTAADSVYGGLALFACYLAWRAARQLARLDARASGLVRTSGTVFTCVSLAGLAAGGHAAHLAATWQLATAVVIVMSARDMVHACRVGVPEASPQGNLPVRAVRGILMFPVGGRVALIAVVAPVWGSRTALLVLLEWGVAATAYAFAGPRPEPSPVPLTRQAQPRPALDGPRLAEAGVSAQASVRVDPAIPVDATLPMDALPMDAPPMDALPVDAVAMDAAATDAMPVDAVAVDAVAVDAAMVAVATEATVPMDAVPMDAVPADAVPVDAVPVDAVPMDAVPADAVAVDVVPVVADAVPADAVAVDVVPVVADAVPADAVAVDVVPVDGVAAAAAGIPPIGVQAAGMQAVAGAPTTLDLLIRADPGGQQAQPAAAPADSRVLSTTLACRDDGAVALRLGRVVRGQFVPLPPALAGLAATSLLAWLGMRNLPGLLLLTPLVVTLLAGFGSAHPHDRGLDWLTPAVLMAVQLEYAAAIGFSFRVPPPLTFTLCALIALRHVSLARGDQLNPARALGARFGWEGRMLVVGVGAMLGVATVAYVALAAQVAWLVADSLLPRYAGFPTRHADLRLCISDRHTTQERADARAKLYRRRRVAERSCCC
jgi:hypothetical protein